MLSNKFFAWTRGALHATPIPKKSMELIDDNVATA